MSKLSEKTEAMLDLLAQRQRDDATTYTAELEELCVVFPLEGQLYGLPITLVKSIVVPGAITPIPGTPAHLLGVVNVRGEIESVLDLRQVLNLPPAAIGITSRLLIAQVGEIRSGLLVDAMHDIIGMTESDCRPRPSGLESAEFVSGEVVYGDETFLLLDLPALFARVLGD
jgi:purine-binding chemotaxis protein CheW